jgi:hypothetical protein
METRMRGMFSKHPEAGQGVSYVLLTNGSLYEQMDQSQQNPSGRLIQIQNGVVSMSAGTDRYGVSSVDVVLTTGSASEYSNTSGWHLLANGVHAISAGQMGESEILLQNGNAYDYREATNSATYLGASLIQITAGTDATGNAVIDLINSGGNFSEYRSGSGWVNLGVG